jgi:hypothetical protein
MQVYFVSDALKPLQAIALYVQSKTKAEENVDERNKTMQTFVD